MELLYSLFVVLLGSSFNISTVKSLKMEEILNGLLVDPPRFKYVVAVIYKVENAADVNPCAGSILNRRYISTVAHCFFNKRHGTYIHKQFFIVGSILNLWYPNYTTRYIQVDLVITPAYYQPTQPDTYNTRGDLAVVRLSESLGYLYEYHPIFATVSIPGPLFTHQGREFVVSGYGWNRFIEPLDGEIMPTGVSDGSLRYAAAKILSTFECQHLIGDKIAEGNMCARVEQWGLGVPMGICQFDSGGPLVFQDKLKGIAINGFLECNERQLPGIYINTTYYADFIANATAGRITNEMRVVQLRNILRNQYMFRQFQITV